MPLEIINVGAAADDPAADSARAGFQKVNQVIAAINDGAVEIPAAGISDSSAAGRDLLTAADATAQLAALGAVSATAAALSDRRRPLCFLSDRDPTADDDETAMFAAGRPFQIGDEWRTPDRFWKLLDPTAGAAVWVTGLSEEQLAIVDAAASALTAEAVLPPYTDVLNSAAALNLSMDHHMGIVLCTHAAPVLNLRAQASYAWGSRVLIQIDADHPYQVVAAAGVSINGQVASTWNGLAAPAAATLRRVAGTTNQWRLNGAVELDT